MNAMSAVISYAKMGFIGNSFFYFMASHSSPHCDSRPPACASPEE
jgi:hypothetical protein